MPGALFRKRLSPDQSNKVWIGLEEFKASGQNMVDLVPAVGVTARYRRFDRSYHSASACSNTLRYIASLVGK